MRTSTLSKVPAVTLGFWIIKIMTTTVGETGADYLAVNAGWGTGLATGFIAVLLLVVLLFQIFLNRCVPAIYWLTVVLVSVVGTQITDVLTDKFEVSLYISTAVFSLVLSGLFFVWHHVETTLSIDSIHTRRRELFYWGTVLCTFALGTAAGDLATEALGLGFKLGVLVFGAMIALAAVAYFFRINSVLIFWITYVLTRPLGAALGDFLSQAREYGGEGFGSLLTSAIFLSVIIVVVAFLSFFPNRGESVGGKWRNDH
jgi:uncharacterized membrane-anchored protein